MEIESTSPSNHPIGSLAWGASSRGVMADNEKSYVIENLRLVMNQEQLDADRRRLGLLNPKAIAIDTLTPPDSRILKDALAYARETHVPGLLRHSWRTYYFGALIASHDQIEFDRELGFTAAILHDIGLTADANPKPCDCCFAIGGALQAREFLLQKGHNREHADAIAHAIAVHLNMHVSAEEHGATAFLVTRGAVCDVFGTGVSRMAPESIKEVLGAYSREDLYVALNPDGCNHLAGTRLDVLSQSLSNVEGGHSKHPLDMAPYA
jgi:hypothetical protein